MKSNSNMMRRSISRSLLALLALVCASLCLITRAQESATSDPAEPSSTIQNDDDIPEASSPSPSSSSTESDDDDDDGSSGDGGNGSAGGEQKKKKNWANTIVRCVVPLAVIYVYFVYNGDQKAPKETYYRANLLAMRSQMGQIECPEELETMRLICAEEAPHLFKKPPPQANARASRQNKKNAKQQEADNQLQLENLVNFIAFSPFDRRVFLPPDGTPPPPPAGPGEKIEVSEDAMRSANSEVQVILRGAVKYKQLDVAKELLQHLCDHCIRVEEQTWKLLVDVAVACEELQIARDYIMMMENSGLAPSASILEHVMSLCRKDAGGDSNTNGHIEGDTGPRRRVNPPKPKKTGTGMSEGSEGMVPSPTLSESLG